MRILSGIFFFVLACAFYFMTPGQSVFAAGHGSVGNGAGDHAVAEVYGKKITVNDIKKFAANSPSFSGYLQVPGGANKILSDMILRELLYLEGHDMEIPETPGMEKEVYVKRVMSRIFPKKPEFTKEELKKFYDSNPGLFSTPIFVRLSEIRVYIGKGGEKAARKRIEEAQKHLEDGESFGETAAQYSQDELSRDRKGDLGFLPLNDIKPDKVRVLLKSMKKGQVSNIVQVPGYYAIFKITDIREPVLEPFNEKFVKEKAEKYLAEKAMNDIRTRLAKKWGVKYLDPAFEPTGNVLLQ